MEGYGVSKDLLNDILQRIKDVVSPKQIILFGSASRNEMGVNSDLDLLVVVPAGYHRRRTAQAIYRNMIGVGFAVDLVVVTEEDVDRYRNDPGMVIKPALEEGMLLYAA